uniref:Protein NIM1-INTERACTING 1 n=1 Tax=Nelumbo nucifera TaxID=4432 RepID=A0A822YFQ0_NELNU|nr:TPA_asm: hypothetical protein HUJ06_011855 [Nelumbo nucifera]
MEAERKKRSAIEEEVDDDDEEKMEKFFALITNFRNVRDQLRDKALNTRSKEKESDKQEKPLWTPSFQREDFMAEDVQFKSSSSALPGPSSQRHEQDKSSKQKKEEEEEEELDLRLSL